MSPFSITNPVSKRSAAVTAPTESKDRKANPKDAKVPADSQAEDPAPTSRPLSPVTNQSFDSKDARAYEHARQRSKHAQDFAKKRAKKEEKAEQRRNAAAAARGAAPANGKTSGGVGSGHGKAASSGAGAARLVSSADVEVDEDEILMAPIERGASGKPSQLQPLSPPSSPNSYKPDHTIRVSLADLIVISDKKTKKAGLKRADDFEVVPHVKAVIALDDGDDFEMELDEPWEHVQVDEGRGRGRFKDEPSYASIVAGMVTPVALD